MSYIIINAENAYGQRGAYVARITGTDRRYGLSREFLVGCSPRITEPGVYESCDVDRKGRKDKTYWLAIPDDAGVLQRICIREETAFEIIQSGRPVTDLRVVHNSEGELTCRANGELTWRSAQPDADDLRAERDRLAARIAEIDAILGTSS